MKKGILIHEPNDDEGVADMDLTAGEEIAVVSLEGKLIKQIKLSENVLLGHKVAMQDLALNKHIVEYGRAIGYAAAPISAGSHVHVNNLKSLRWSGSTAQVLQRKED